MSELWAELPDFNEVRAALRKQAELKAQLRVVELELDILQAECVQRKPRDSSVKLVGVDEDSKRRLYEAHRRVLDVNAALDEVEAEVRFNDYRKEAAKIMGFKGRV